jgi:amidohydrolase
MPEHSTTAAGLERAKAEARRRAEAAADDLIRLSHEIHGHPELGFEEHRASEWVGSALAGAGIGVDKGVGGLDTALTATTGAGPLTLGVCAEYDALPRIGHACGHNIIAASAVGAAVALTGVAEEFGLTVRLLGTPAEEGGGGKILMLDGGAFDGVHGALMVHPAPADARQMQALARARFEASYQGHAAHASMFPYEGRNAADALVVAQVALGLLRQQLRPGEQLHGITTMAGDVPSVIPDRATASYAARTPQAGDLDDLLRRAYACFEAGAVATGTELTIGESALRYTHFEPDTALADAYVRNATALGRQFTGAAGQPQFGGSTDMANISLAMPAIHPLIGIDSGTAVNHQAEFAGACAQPSADQAVVQGAIAMAWTMLDIAADPAIRASFLAESAARTGAGARKGPSPKGEPGHAQPQ